MQTHTHTTNVYAYTYTYMGEFFQRDKKDHTFMEEYNRERRKN